MKVIFLKFQEGDIIALFPEEKTKYRGQEVHIMRDFIFVLWAMKYHIFLAIAFLYVACRIEKSEYDKIKANTPERKKAA